MAELHPLIAYYGNFPTSHDRESQSLYSETCL